MLITSRHCEPENNCTDIKQQNKTNKNTQRPQSSAKANPVWSPDREWAKNKRMNRASGVTRVGETRGSKLMVSPYFFLKKNDDDRFLVITLWKVISDDLS